MTRLCAYTPPEGILDSIAQYLSTDEHIDLPVDKMQFVTNGDTTNRDKDKILVSLGMDFQQAATPVSVYARIMVRVEEPQSGTLTGLLPDTVYLSFRLAYHIKRYSLKSNTLISCDIDAAPTLMVEGLRQYAYMVLLCTVPMTGVAGGGSDTPKEPYKDEYSGDSAKLILNEDCDPELGGMWYTSRKYMQGEAYLPVLTAFSSNGLVVPPEWDGNTFLVFNRAKIQTYHKYLVSVGVTALFDPHPVFPVLGVRVLSTADTQFTGGINLQDDRALNALGSIATGETVQQTVIDAGMFWSDYPVQRIALHNYNSSWFALTHFQVTDITEHPELAPANAAKLLAESNRLMKKMNKMEAALAPRRTEEMELDFGDET